MHVRESAAEDQRQEAWQDQKKLWRRLKDEFARKLRRGVRFGRLREQDLSAEQKEMLRQLKAGELTVTRAEPKVSIETKLARFLGAYRAA